MRRINDTGTTIFLTTQYLEEADELCDRLAIIDDGKLVAEGTPEHLKAEMGNDVVSVDLSGADPAATEAGARGARGPRARSSPSRARSTLYVEDGAGSIVEIVRQLDSATIPVGAISVSRPRSTTSSSRRPAAGSRGQPGERPRSEEERR